MDDDKGRSSRRAPRPPQDPRLAKRLRPLAQRVIETNYTGNLIENDLDAAIAFIDDE